MRRRAVAVLDDVVDELKRQPPRVCGALPGSGMSAAMPPTLLDVVVADDVD